MDKCPVCETNIPKCNKYPGDYEPYYEIECMRCGKYKITSMLVEQMTQGNTQDLWKVSHWIRINQRLMKDTIISSDNLDDIFKSVIIPKPYEKADMFIKWLGETLASDESVINIRPSLVSSIICTKDQIGVEYVLIHLYNQHLLACRQAEMKKWSTAFIDDTEFKIGLTFKGWERFHEITQKGVFSKKAFMAMKYNSQAHTFCNEHLKTAVKQTNFDLVILNDVIGPGLIDDQLRVQIRNSRFLLADLSDSNNGAYWEAGYAEGLGKPVIYLCEESVFNDENNKPHFDTNHLTTIIWNENNPEEAKEKLKSIIRITFPNDARMTDDSD